MRDVTRAPLGRHTTLRLGGPAGRLVPVTEEEQIPSLVRDAGATAEPLLILAGGSNVVIADEGFPGTVLLLRTTGVDVAADGERVLLTVAAGQPWDDVAALAAVEGWAGIECLAGIPGSAGATPIQNVGAYGQEVAETIAWVRGYDRLKDEVVRFSPDECGFAYRTSVFKHNDRYVLLSVTFRLARSPLSGPVRYAELARSLDVPVGARAPVAEVRSAVLALRAGKGMVLDPNDPDTYSVGSFFVNPVLDPGRYATLRAKALARAGTEPTAWVGTDGSVKVSAAWLIERAGFGKGYAAGFPGVAISGKHTLALTNRGSGSTAALLDLARHIRDGVRAAFDVDLYPEPVLIGCRM